MWERLFWKEARNIDAAHHEFVSSTSGFVGYYKFMLRNLRLVLAMLITVAFMASGWATMAAAAAECMGCDGQMQDMGHMDGKQKPSEDCMLKVACSAINAQLPVPTPVDAAVIYTAAGYPAGTAATYSSHQIAPPLSPPRLFA